jgi:WD40 repeat protein
VTSLEFSPDGKTLVAGSYDKTLRRWNVVTAKPAGVFATRQGGVLSVAVGGKADLWVVAGWKGFALWDARRGRERIAVESGKDALTYCVAMSHDGTWVASGGSGDEVKLWRVKDLLRRPTAGGRRAP